MTGSSDRLEEIKRRHHLDEVIQHYLQTSLGKFIPLEEIKSELNGAIKSATPPDPPPDPPLTYGKGGR
jgi:hypothetical protein